MFDGIALGAFLNTVRPLSLKQAGAIPIVATPGHLAAHLGVAWDGSLVGELGIETLLPPPLPSPRMA